MKSFDIKTKVYFGDNALDRLSEIPYKKVLVLVWKASFRIFPALSSPFF